MANSKYLLNYKNHRVVNCFQISNFVLWQTAAPIIGDGYNLL